MGLFGSNFKKVIISAACFAASVSCYGDAYWGTPATVATGTAVDAFALALNMNDNGDAIAAWFDGTNVLTSILPAGSSTWPAPTIVAAASGVNEIAVAIDINKNAAIGYITNRYLAGTAEAFLSYLPSGGAWTTPSAPVGPIASDTIAHIYVSIDNNGLAVAGWVQGPNSSSTGSNNIFTTTTGTWARDTLFPGGPTGSEPQKPSGYLYGAYLFGDSNGDLVAIWPASIPSTFFSSRVGGIWSTPTILPATLIDHGAGNSPAAATVNNAGDGVIAYSNFNGTSTIATGAPFTLPSTIGSTTSLETTSGFTQPSNYATAIDSNGNGVAIWTTSTDTTLNSSYYNNTTGLWSVSSSVIFTGIDNSAVNSYYNNKVIQDTTDNSVVVFLNPSTNVIDSAQSASGGTWTIADQISTIGATASLPLASASKAGLSIAMWKEVNGGVTTIKFTTHGTITPPTPPINPISNLNGVTKMNRFATQANLFQVLSWTASSSSSVISYNIYKGNGTSNLLGTVSAFGPLQFTIDGTPISQATTYSVVPVSDSGALGPVTTITLPPFKN